MYSDEADDTSCSDCKLELIEKRWTQLLLNWVNRCVHPRSPVKELTLRSLVEVINKYKDDICVDELDKAILCNDDLEPFLQYKYPILRLRNFWEEKDIPKKIYIMHTILLFHCLISSLDGDVDSDVCIHLEKHEQEMILKFCEKLSDMEVTANNIEFAIQNACDSVKPGPTKPMKYQKYQPEPKSPKARLIKTDSNDVTPVNTKVSETSIPSDPSLTESMKKKFTALKFKASHSLATANMGVDSSYSDVDFVLNYTDVNADNSEPTEIVEMMEMPKRDKTEKAVYEDTKTVQLNFRKRRKMVEAGSDSYIKALCQPDCSCSRCSPSGPCCGDPGRSTEDCYKVTEAYNLENNTEPEDKGNMLNLRKENENWKIFLIIAVVLTLIIVIAIVSSISVRKNEKKDENLKSTKEEMEGFRMANGQKPRVYQPNSYICKDGLCQKLFEPTSGKIFKSLSRCTLQCMGPQLWPYPVGYTQFSKKVVSLATNRLEYKFQSIPSEAVNMFIAEAFKLFLGDLAKLERYNSEPRKEDLNRDMMINKLYIQIDIENDPDPRLRVDTEESYAIKIETVSSLVSVKLHSASFCGMRHALETLSQLILLDQSTGDLITLSEVIIKDAPSYRYRGLMIDTGRNYIPVPDLMRTIDAMASCKLNTFHWRISDVTSFPLYLPAIPQLFEYGSYDRGLVYTKDDVKAVVKRAAVRGIRVLMEVAAPGPVGRAWSWVPEASCPTKHDNNSCSNVLCLRLGMKSNVFDMLQIIYTEILDMTNVDDIFHLSDSVFSLANCFYLVEEREGFLDKALERLKMANKGFLPKLPIIWYTTHLTKDKEAQSWERFGVQLTEWLPSPSEPYLNKFKVIHSSRWDLSCEIKKQRCKRYRTWQEMYSWKSWRNIEAFTVEGGEALLWTDMVDSSNLDYHLWPRGAAVAERLWSDIALNGSVTRPVYIRLDNHRWRMVLKGLQVQPIWPLYCSFSPGVCLEQINKINKKYFFLFY